MVFGVDFNIFEIKYIKMYIVNINIKIMHELISTADLGT